MRAHVQLSLAGPLLAPGEHLVMFGDAGVGTWGRRRGYEVRDCVLVVEDGQVRPAWLFKAGLSSGTVVEGVLNNGRGGLFIDGCRITGAYGCASVGTGKGHAETEGHGRYNGVGGVVQPPHPGGRWPTNTLFVHGPNCREAGVRRVESTGIARSAPIVATRRTGVHADAGGHQAVGRQQPVTGYANDDGTEDVMAWACAEGCLVPVLDEQSGDRETSKPGQVFRRTDKPANIYGDHTADVGREQVAYGDTGGASRFFPQLGAGNLDDWFATLLGNL